MQKNTMWFVPHKINWRVVEEMRKLSQPFERTERNLLYAVNKFFLKGQTYYEQDKKVKEYDSNFFTFMQRQECFTVEIRCISWVVAYSERPTSQKTVQIDDIEMYQDEKRI